MTFGSVRPSLEIAATTTVGVLKQGEFAAMKTMFKKPLHEATTQEIQLELIRRTEHNYMSGERLVATLLEHRELWEAVLLDRISFSRPGKLPASGLIKLRDLSHNYWNTDTLFILTPSKASAAKLSKFMKADKWGGEMIIHTDPEDVDSALGSGRETRAVISIWSD